MTPQKEEERIRIVVGTNSLTETQYPAYTNHCQMWFRFGRSYPNIDFIFMNPSRMSIDRMRNATVTAALEWDAKYVLFLDDDVIVDPIVGLKQLLSCNADCAAGKVVIRGYPFDYMVFKYPKGKIENGLISMSNLPKHGIHNYDAVGFSFCLLKVDIFKRLKTPWFVTGLQHTEDIYFCMKARMLDRKYSIRVNCDCECGHILWPEIMCPASKSAYKRYFEKINPQVKPPKIDPCKWRGDSYLKDVKELIADV